MLLGEFQAGACEFGARVQKGPGAPEVIDMEKSVIVALNRIPK